MSFWMFGPDVVLHAVVKNTNRLGSSHNRPLGKAVRFFQFRNSDPFVKSDDHPRTRRGAAAAPRAYALSY